MRSCEGKQPYNKLKFRKAIAITQIPPVFFVDAIGDQVNGRQTQYNQPTNQPISVNQTQTDLTIRNHLSEERVQEGFIINNRRGLTWWHMTNWANQLSWWQWCTVIDETPYSKCNAFHIRLFCLATCQLSPFQASTRRCFNVVTSLLTSKQHGNNVKTII